MKFELDAFQITEILQVLKDKYKFQRQYFTEHPNETEGLTMPENIKKLYNYILSTAHDAGELTFLNPIA